MAIVRLLSIPFSEIAVCIVERLPCFSRSDCRVIGVAAKVQLTIHLVPNIDGTNPGFDFGITLSDEVIRPSIWPANAEGKAVASYPCLQVNNEYRKRAARFGARWGAEVGGAANFGVNVLAIGDVVPTILTKSDV